MGFWKRKEPPVQRAGAASAQLRDAPPHPFSPLDGYVPLRHGETVFLDDMTVEELSQGLGVPVIPVEQDGFALFETIFGV